MKRFCSHFLIGYLIFGIGSPLYARINSGYDVREREFKQQVPQRTRDWQDTVSRNEKQDTLMVNGGEEHPANEEIRSTRRGQISSDESQNGVQSNENTKIRLAGNQLSIEDLPEDGLLEIYNIMGVKVYNRRVKAGTNQYVLPLSRGYYIIKIGKLTRKIAVR